MLDSGAIHPLPTLGEGPSSSDLTIVIPALDVPADELARLVAQAGPVGEVIVVDDGSAPPIGPVAGARLVRRDVNGGPGPARNTALAEVTTPFVAFLDADVQVEGEWLAPLLAHFADPGWRSWHHGCAARPDRRRWRDTSAGALHSTSGPYRRGRAPAPE